MRGEGWVKGEGRWHNNSLLSRCARLHDIHPLYTYGSGYTSLIHPGSKSISDYPYHPYHLICGRESCTCMCMCTCMFSY